VTPLESGDDDGTVQVTLCGVFLASKFRRRSEDGAERAALKCPKLLLPAQLIIDLQTKCECQLLYCR
jgi:hypothetical protein